eukprot:TRINITY_DN2889_c0_g2_i1.p1 TRINITY_DN2889_c0_g2~~TRINITY_DN2889_c0_g2_i1.p1  ORF type:complete len:268 (-),score=24.54 TRINITY_DN2889_c0_g2_i1:51-854(-)
METIVANFPLLPITVTTIFFIIVNITSHHFSSFTATYRLSSDFDKVLWNSRIVSMVHAAIVLVLWFYCFFLAPVQYEDVIWDTTPTGRIMVLISFGYFVWDIMSIIKNFKVFGPPFLIHALYCLAVNFAAVMRVFEFYMAAFLILEGSTPFLNVYMIMGHIEATHKTQPRSESFKRLKDKIGIVFGITFIIVRIIIGNYLYFHVWRLSFQRWNEIPALVWWFYRSITIFSELLNAKWLLQILNRAAAPRPYESNDTTRLYDSEKKLE